MLANELGALEESLGVSLLPELGVLDKGTGDGALVVGETLLAGDDDSDTGLACG